MIGEKKRLLNLPICILFVLLISLGQAEGKVTLTYALTSPENHPWSIGSIKLSKVIATKSGGDLKIKIYPPYALGNPRDVLEGIKSGIIDMGNISTRIAAIYVKPMEIFSLPFLFRDNEQAKNIMSGAIGETLLKEGKKHGFVGLSFLPSEFPYIANKIRPIEKLADLKGLRIRIESPKQKAIYESLGAIPMSMPWGELYTALQTGVVDGTEAPPYWHYRSKSYLASKYVTELPTSYSPGIIVMNAKRWNGMAPDHQKTVLASIPQTIETVERELRSQKENFIQASTGRRAEFYYVKDLTPFKDACKPVYDQAKYVMPEQWARIAYRISYETFDLEVRSDPQGADVYYKRTGDRYKKYRRCTDCVVKSLIYAIWRIKVSKQRYKAKVKDFDPFREENMMVFFKLEKP